MPVFGELREGKPTEKKVRHQQNQRPLYYCYYFDAVAGQANLLGDKNENRQHKHFLLPCGHFKQTNKHHRSVLPAARLRVRTLCRQGRIRKVFPHSYSLRQTRQDTCNKKKQPTTTSRGTRQVKYRRTRPQPSRPSSRYRRGRSRAVRPQDIVAAASKLRLICVFFFNLQYIHTGTPFYSQEHNPKMCIYIYIYFYIVQNCMSKVGSIACYIPPTW